MEKLQQQNLTQEQQVKDILLYLLALASASPHATFSQPSSVPAPKKQNPEQDLTTILQQQTFTPQGISDALNKAAGGETKTITFNANTATPVRIDLSTLQQLVQNDLLSPSQEEDSDAAEPAAASPQSQPQWLDLKEEAFTKHLRGKIISEQDRDAILRAFVYSLLSSPAQANSLRGIYPEDLFRALQKHLEPFLVNQPYNLRYLMEVFGYGVVVNVAGREVNISSQEIWRDFLTPLSSTRSDVTTSLPPDSKSQPQQSQFHHSNRMAEMSSWGNNCALHCVAYFLVHNFNRLTQPQKDQLRTILNQRYTSLNLTNDTDLKNFIFHLCCLVVRHLLLIHFAFVAPQHWQAFALIKYFY